MKKRHPHDISDMASPDEKVSTVSSYRRPLRTEPRTSVSIETKSVEDDKSKDKSIYEFGQPAFRRDLRKQIEVKIFNYLALWASFKSGVIFVCVHDQSV